MSHVNDGGFRIVAKHFTMTVKQTLMTWSVRETVLCVVGFAMVLIVWAIVWRPRRRDGPPSRHRAAVSPPSSPPVRRITARGTRPGDTLDDSGRAIRAAFPH